MKKSLTMLLLACMLSLSLVGCAKEDAIVNEEEINLESFAGSYQDSWSGRASMDVTYNEDDTLTAKISWASSASECAEWTMTLTKDNDKLKYTNALYEVCSYDMDGNRTVINTENEDGFFQVYEGKLLWTGSKDSYSRECTFEKIPMDVE